MLRRCLGQFMLSLHAQATPNPLCHAFQIPSDHYENFVPDGVCCEVAHRGLAWVHPLSRHLFEQYPQEITSVFLAPRRVSITVFANVNWPTVEWSISSLLGHYLVFNNECVEPAKEYALIEDDLRPRADDSEVVQCIKELLREQVRPMVQRDGGDVKLLGFDNASGVVSLAMLGACRNCPSSQNTLKQGIERVMKHFLPEVTQVIEDKNHRFYADYELVIDSEKVLFDENARLDKERIERIKPKLTRSLLSFDALAEPSGE